MTAYGGATYAYGANGELQTKTVGSGMAAQVTSYSYDAFGNLLDVTPPTGSAVDYVVDGMNRRVGRKVGGTLVQGLLYKNQLNSVAELDGSGALVAQYVYGTKANVPDVRVDAAGNVYRVLSDHLGSPRLVVKVSDGTIAERMDFDEFGNETIASGASISMPFGFAGGLSDQQTGLVRFGARDYDPATGRWTSKDPIRFAGGQSNIYVYSNDDPVNALDPNGTDSNSCEEPPATCCPDSPPFPPGCLICTNAGRCPKTGGGSGICNRDLSTTCTFQCAGQPGETKKVKRINQKLGYECQYPSQAIDPNQTCPDAG